MNTQVIVRQLLYALPGVIVCAVGLFIGMANLQKWSRPAFWLIIGCSLLLFGALASPVLYIALIQTNFKIGPANNMVARTGLEVSLWAPARPVSAPSSWPRSPVAKDRTIQTAKLGNKSLIPTRSVNEGIVRV